MHSKEIVLNPQVKPRILIMALLLLAIPFYAALAEGSYNIQPAQRPLPPDGNGGVFGGDGGAGGSNHTTCAVQCKDGSWSGIACNSDETAVCGCSGSPVQASPYCLWTGP